MLSGSSSIPGRLDLVRTPTEVFLERDCFCFMQRNINGVINTTGKIKSKNHSPDVPDGCMKKNTASAKTTGTGFIKPEHHHVHEDSPGIFTNFKNQSKICFYKCTETVVKQPEKMIDKDDAKLYASSQEFTPHEMVDDKDDVEPVEDSEDAVEEMGEGSDDGSGFFLGYQNRVCNEKDERVGQKTQRHDAPRQGSKVAVPAECRSELAAPAVGSAENKPQYQEKLKFKALYSGLLHLWCQFITPQSQAVLAS